MFYSSCNNIMRVHVRLLFAYAGVCREVWRRTRCDIHAARQYYYLRFSSVFRALMFAGAHTVRCAVLVNINGCGMYRHACERFMMKKGHSSRVRSLLYALIEGRLFLSPAIDLPRRQKRGMVGRL